MSVYVETMKKGARLVGLSFTDPDDDWVPMLTIVSETGQVATIEVADFFLNDHRKHLFAETVLPQLVEDMQVVELVLVTSAWISRVEGQLDEPLDIEVMPRDDPERAEVLIVSRMTAEGLEMHSAPIGRDPRGGTPPTLGEFEVWPEGQGQLTEAAIEALRKRQKGTT